MPREALALLVPVLGFSLAFSMDRLAAVRRLGGERGDYWVRAAAGLCGIGFLCLLSGWLPSIFKPLWTRGLHLQLDRVAGSGLPRGVAYLAALALPFGLWAALLLAGLALPPAGRESSRWLAGRAGDLSRGWVLVCVLPLLAGLLFGFPRLGSGPEGYPAATWSTQALLSITLLFLARSAGTAPLARRGRQEKAPAALRELRPWPEALRERGIALRRLLAWPADPPPQQAAAETSEIAGRLEAMGTRGVAPELVEATARLLAPARKGPPSCLVFAPDGCGQAEVVGLAAGDVAQRFNETTLVIAPSQPAALAASLGRWLPPGCLAEPVGPDGAPVESAAIWVIDAETLSERFLRRLSNDRLANRIGLVVWWDVHRYTGVLAANVWAIARRFDRLLRAEGRSEVRLLVFVRGADHGDAQLHRFVRELLPYSLPSGCEVHVARHSPRALEIHLLEGHQATFEGGNGLRIPELGRHPLLVSALISAEEGWPTCLERPHGLADFEINPVVQLPVDGVRLQDRLLPNAAGAGARLSELEAGDLLSLTAMACQGGRSSPEGLPHHWGLLPPDNPYARFLLTRWAESAGSRELPASRRLVGARGNPSLLRRHLLLALSERKDTLAGLKQAFRWEEELIRETLEWIAGERQLDRSREVRYLTPEGRVRGDHLYESRLPAEDEVRPLDAVGTRLIAIREAAGGAGDGVCMRVDPERLTIQAYPGRVFLQDGRRYEVITWESLDQVVARGWIDCVTQSSSVRTWRIRRPNVYRFHRPGPEVAVDPQGRLLKRLAVDLTYEEEVEGYLRLERDLTTGQDRIQLPDLRRPIASAFTTRALLFRLPYAPSREALEALCLALRYVLPVHLGVEDDALEVVALPGEPEHRLGGAQFWGLAIVDLYPGGIGLADSLAEDNALPLKLLSWTRDWLSEPEADTALLASPLARATLGRELPDPAAALDLLVKLVGNAGS